MSISSDEVNFLVYRYLQENGFAHSAFTFAYESLVIKSSIAQTEIPPGALITFLQKGLEYISIEEHIDEDGTIKEFENNYSLLSPLICEAVAVKEDRRVRKPSAVVNSLSNGADNSVPMEEEPSSSNSELQSLSIGIDSNPIIIGSNVNLIADATSRYLRLSGHQSEVFMCKWNPVKNQVASGSADGMCRLWNLTDITPDKWNSNISEFTLTTSIMPHSTLDGEKNRDVTSLTWSPDGQFVASGCYDGMARIWDHQGRLKMFMREHSGPVYSLKYSKSGNYILSGSFDRRAIVWSTKTGLVVKSYSLHSDPVMDVDWRDEDVFATCSIDKSIQICRVSSPDSNPIVKLLGHKNEVNAVCWSPSGQFLASCSDDSTAKIWTIEDGLKFDLVGHNKEIFNVKWTPTGPGSANPEKPLYLCSASFDGTAKIWNGFTGELTFTLSKDQIQSVYSLDPSPNGKFIATGALGGIVSVWSLQTGQMLKEVQGQGDTFDVSWNNDGSYLCSCFSSGVIYIVDNTDEKANIKQ
eukprot:gene5151-7171_t